MLSYFWAGCMALSYDIDDDNRESNMAIAQWKFEELWLKSANGK